MAQKRRFQISTPRGTLYQTRNKNGKTTVRLSWEQGFGPKYSNGFSKAQEFIDSECLRYCDPLTPRRTGYMIKSGQLGTVIGSGGNRGKLWFERMKASKKETIRKGAANFVSSK